MNLNNVNFQPSDYHQVSIRSNKQLGLRCTLSDLLPYSILWHGKLFLDFHVMCTTMSACMELQYTYNYSVTVPGI